MIALFCRPLAAMLTVLTATSAVAAPPTPPAMSLKERKEMLQAASFDLATNGQIVRNCGERVVAAKPAVAMIDFNGDGKPEAVVLSQNDCPGDDGPSNRKLHTSILYRDVKENIWRNVLDVDGQLKRGEGATGGWLNVNIVDGTTVIPYVHDAGEQLYERLSFIQYKQHVVLAARPDRTPPGVLPTAGWPTPWSTGNLTPGQLAQLFTAAGYKRVGGVWKGCSGASDAEVPADDNILNGTPIMDLNGDGNPEVIVRDSSFECYGNSGGAFYILTPVPGGWKVVADGLQDSPFILPQKSRTGWRDIASGGPGFCHERYRNDGKGYQAIGQYEETPGGCSR